MEQCSDALTHRKFGKHIQKRQLDIPEYAASFVDYKALKKVYRQHERLSLLRKIADFIVVDKEAQCHASDTCAGFITARYRSCRFTSFATSK